jgi:hypothetical protein
MVTNASALQGMGMNAADAAYLLGELETSGVDVSAVMAGFAKIQQKAMDEGISMQDAFRKALSNSDSAIDYFGKKSAPKLFEAFHNGTLSADLFTGGIHDLNDAFGNLDKTYDATLDPTDQLTVAINNLKIVGHDLGEAIQKELAPIIEEVTKYLKDFRDWFVSLDDDPATTQTDESKKPVVGVDIRGNVYGGGNNAEVTGDTNVNIGKKSE